jgi:hypothetical protein
MYKSYIKNTSQRGRKKIYNLLLIGPLLLVLAVFAYNYYKADFMPQSQQAPSEEVEQEKVQPTSPSGGEGQVYARPLTEEGFGDMTVKEQVEFWRDSLVSLTPLLISLLAFLGRRKVVGDK